MEHEVVIRNGRKVTLSNREPIQSVGLNKILSDMKRRKNQEQGAVIYIRISARIRDKVYAQLQKDGLTYKDLLTAAISEYLGYDVTSEA